MCVVSMVADDWNERWEQRPWYPNTTGPALPNTNLIQINPFPPITPTQEEFDKLKYEVEILKEQLKRAKEYDEKNNEPDCELEEKMNKLREIAKIVGIDLDDIIKKIK